MNIKTILLICCLVKGFNSDPVMYSTIWDAITVGTNQQVLNATAQANKAMPAGATVKPFTVPYVPELPKDADIKKIQLPYPTKQEIDIKAVIKFFNDLCSKINFSVTIIINMDGPPKDKDCQSLKANITIEKFKDFTPIISEEIAPCSKEIDPALKEFASCACGVIDEINKATTSTDKKKSAQDIEKAFKKLAIALKKLCDETNKMTKSLKPEKDSNLADCVAALEKMLNSCLKVTVDIATLASSCTKKMSLPPGESDICEKLKSSSKSLCSKTADGSIKIIGSECDTYIINITVLIKSFCSVDIEDVKQKLESEKTEIKTLCDSLDQPEDKPKDESNATLSTCRDISAKIKISFELIISTCTDLNTDVPGVTGNVDALIKKLENGIAALLAVLQESEKADKFESSKKMDAAIDNIVSIVSDLKTASSKIQAESKDDKSVATTTGMCVLDLLYQISLNILFCIFKSIKVVCEKNNYIPTPKLHSVCTITKDTKVEKVADSEEVVGNLSKCASKTDVKASACNEVVDSQVISATTAVDTLGKDDSGVSEKKISCALSAIGYTTLGLNAFVSVLKTVDCMMKIEVTVAILIRRCVELTKEDGGTTEVTEPKSIESDTIENIIVALLNLLNEAQLTSQSDDKSSNKEASGVCKNNLKAILKILQKLLDGCSKKLTEKNIRYSVLYTLIIKFLADAAEKSETNYEDLGTGIKGIQCHGKVVDSVTPDLDKVKEGAKKVTEAKSADDAKAFLPDFSGKVKTTLTTCSENWSTLKIYFGNATESFKTDIADIMSAFEKLMETISKSKEGDTEVEPVCKDSFKKIGWRIVYLCDSYKNCLNNTDLKPDGTNAASGMKIMAKTCISAIDFSFKSLKVAVGEWPPGVKDLFTELAGACEADAKNPNGNMDDLRKTTNDACNKFDKSEGGDGGTKEEGA